MSSDSASNPAASAQLLTAVASAIVAGVGMLLVVVVAAAGADWDLGLLLIAAIGAVCGLLGGLRAAKTGAYLVGLAVVFVAFLAADWGPYKVLILLPLAIFSIGCGIGSAIGYSIGRLIHERAAATLPAPVTEPPAAEVRAEAEVPAEPVVADFGHWKTAGSTRREVRVGSEPVLSLRRRDLLVVAAGQAVVFDLADLVVGASNGLLRISDGRQTRVDLSPAAGQDPTATVSTIQAAQGAPRQG